ncbi:hypothetical protein FRX31_002985 [Thalictrum thalictroides]|uniref:Pectinesterase inhibitor domain-containing protein n=1 Tax=Thalictrum thalictroides TaxID=46969 RepID=A0A7J6XD07_THATH|nr:hypothetical protein FRX31_002985 [Thalictrum thalictroides]
MASNQHLIIIFAATTAIFFLASAHAAQINPAELCPKTDFPFLCKAILKNVHGGCQRALKANIAATIIQTSKTMAALEHLLPTATGKLKQCLDQTKTEYENAIYNMVSVLKAMKEKDKGTVDSNLAAVYTGYSQMNDCFDELHVAHNPFIHENQVLKELATNSLTFGNEIKYQG